MVKKNKQSNQKVLNNTLPVWNLGDLYSSINSRKILKDLNLIEKLSKSFSKKYEGKVTKLSAIKLLKAIEEIEKIDEIIDKILSYAHLLVSENIENEKNKIFFQQMQEKITKFSSMLIFFTLELNQISDKKIKIFFKEKKLIKYKNWIINRRSFKPYQLDKKLEKLLQDKSLTSSSAWIRLFDDTIAALRFPFKNKLLSSAEILNFLSDNKTSTRKAAAKSVGKTLGKNINLFSTITNTLAKDKSINDEWRKLPNPVSARNLSNVVEDKVVDALSNTVSDSYKKLSHRYYAIKAKWFGLKKLKYWDRNAPLPFQSKKQYTWDSARKIVTKAYTDFNPSIGKIVEIFFEKSWIHAPVMTGKSPGAFSASTVPSAHPYILLNFQGKSRDVATLAHELGHGVHQYLSANKQGHFNSSTPLTLAETASVFGEMLTFKSLLKNEKNLIEKKALLANKVEDMLNTVVRQIAFYQFEKEVHLQRKKSELSTEEICSIWIQVQKESLGPSIEFEEEYKYYWSYIPHFIHSPFYVYAYAFGDCLVNSLYGVYEEGLSNFDKKYITLLESGGSKDYKNLLKPFHLNPSNSDFWKKGIKVIENFIDDLEKF
ncbi:M3 family oligoendopeptidase [Alphaproteobacteria bacterium]|nr:M3 family oligoendopeptidase [Alphaproteobacteria bacterium]